MKTYDLDYIKKIVQRYGSPLYVFDEKAFVQNYKNLEEEFRSIYPKYNIAYSFKTNYSPYIVSLVKTEQKIVSLSFLEIGFQYFCQFFYLGCIGLSIITVFQLKGLQSKLISYHSYNSL